MCIIPLLLGLTRRRIRQIVLTFLRKRTITNFIVQSNFPKAQNALDIYKPRVYYKSLQQVSWFYVGTAAKQIGDNWITQNTEIKRFIMGLGIFLPHDAIAKRKSYDNSSFCLYVCHIPALCRRC